MIPADKLRQLLSMHGTVQPQPASDWTGDVPLPPSVSQFYEEVGPVDISIESYGNPFFLPRLSKLWERQAGYRWHGWTGERIEDWDADWLVVAGHGAGPFILSTSSGLVLFDHHGRGRW